MATAVVALLALLAAPHGDARARAKAYFDEGQADFKLGRFEEALDEYTHAYEILPLPDLLFNIAQCHRNLQNYARALFFLEGYLRDTEHSKARGRDRPAVERLMAELRQLEAERIAREAARPVTTATITREVLVEVPPPEEPPLYARGWFWGVLVGAAAVAGAAVAVAVVASKDGTPEGDYTFVVK